MTFEQLKTFYVVAQAGSFTNAAQELNMDQSNISRRIISMELRLRTKLFTRKSRGLILTPEGRALLEETKEIISRIEGMKSIIKNVSTEPKGTLHLHIMNSIHDLFLFPYLSDFLNSYPDINLIINKSDSEMPIFESSEMVVAIRPYMQNMDNLVQEFLTRFKMKFYATATYLEKYGTPLSPNDLVKHRLILYGPKTHLVPAMMNPALHGLGANPLVSFVESNCPKTRAYLASQDLGLASLPAELPGLSELKLVEVLPHLHSYVDFFYIYPAMNKKSISIKRFGEFLRSIFR